MDRIENIEHAISLLEELTDNEEGYNYTNPHVDTIHTEALRYIQKALKQQPASPGWMPIESAPEDRNILVWESGIVYEVRISSMYKKFVHVPYAGFSPMWWMEKPKPPQPIACEDENESQSIACEEMLLQFYEPHPTGGDARVRISVEKAIDSQKRSASKRGHEYESDKAALDDFIVCHHAHYITTTTEEAE